MFVEAHELNASQSCEHHGLRRTSQRYGGPRTQRVIEILRVDKIFPRTQRVIEFLVNMTL